MPPLVQLPGLLIHYHQKANFVRGFEAHEMTNGGSAHQCGYQTKKHDPPPSPDVPIRHHLPEGKQTGPRHIPPRAARAPRPPGTGATRGPPAARAAAPFQVSRRTWRPCPRLGGGVGVGVGVGARSPGPGPPGLLRRSRPGRPRCWRGAGGAGRGPEVGRGARGRWRAPGPAAGLTRVATAAARGRGTGSSRDKPKMGNGEAWAAPRGVRSLYLLLSISGRRLDHYGNSQESSQLFRWRMLQPCRLQEGSLEGRLPEEKRHHVDTTWTPRGHHMFQTALVDNKDLDGRNSDLSTGPGTP
ncbi:unnamed protein product [Nyctereutes procyonoides]|uniref:(raccoon dog) hypothetical protein n=1 Tax=Nyctereutes procyonoides TaxID=34880 RepID=A0A811YC41_NYCPR|nr:unnamed protein product [Nyctereutes procyonoides]